MTTPLNPIVADRDQAERVRPVGNSVFNELSNSYLDIKFQTPALHQINPHTHAFDTAPNEQVLGQWARWLLSEVTAPYTTKTFFMNPWHGCPTTDFNNTIHLELDNKTVFEGTVWDFMLDVIGLGLGKTLCDDLHRWCRGSDLRMGIGDKLTRKERLNVLWEGLSVRSHALEQQWNSKVLEQNLESIDGGYIPETALVGCFMPLFLSDGLALMVLDSPLWQSWWAYIQRANPEQANDVIDELIGGNCSTDEKNPLRNNCGC